MKNSLSQRVTNFLKKARIPLLILFGIINITAIAGLIQININPEMDLFMPDESDSRDTYDEIGEIFGSNQQIMVALNLGENDGKTAIDSNQQESISLFSNYLKTQENIDFFTGPKPDQNDKPKLVNNEEMKSLSDLSMSSKIHEGNYYALYSIFPTDNFNNSNMQDLENILTENGLDYAIMGNIYFQKKINDYIKVVLLFLPFAAFALILLTFRVQMGSFKISLLSLLPAGVGALWTFGILGWLGVEVSIFTAIAPVFTIVIGSAAGLHFLSHYSENLQHNSDKKTAIAKTISIIGIPLTITTITSVGGFLSLLLMKTSGLNDLAISSSLGIFIAGFAALTILPIMLLGKMNIKPIAHHNRMGDKILKKLRGIPAIIIALVLLTAGITGAFFLKTNFDQLSMFKKSTVVYKNSSLIQELTGGRMPIYALIQTDNNNPLNSKYAQPILAWQDSLIESSLIKNAFSPYSAISTGYQINQKEMMNKKLQSIPPAMRQKMLQKAKMNENQTYPSDVDVANMIFTKVQQIEPAIAHHANLKESSIRMILFPTDINHESLEAIKESAKEALSTVDGLSIKLTGFDYLMDDLNITIKPSLAKSLGIAILMIFILMLAVLKKFFPALISITPVMVTIAVLFGFLGFTGISLNLVTAAIFSITIGVGIDYAVHFSSVAKTYNDIEKAFKMTSRPIIANSLGLALGMSALFASPFAIHTQLSMLMWLTMIISMFLTLVLLPTLLKGFYKPKTKKEHIELAKRIADDESEEE